MNCKSQTPCWVVKVETDCWLAPCDHGFEPKNANGKSLSIPAKPFSKELKVNEIYG